jgi:hypothetical protein
VAQRLEPTIAQPAGQDRKRNVSKIGIVTEEADESAFWIELLVDLGIAKKERLEDLLQESRELTAIFQRHDKPPKDENSNHRFWQSWQSWQS